MSIATEYFQAVIGLSKALKEASIAIEKFDPSGKNARTYTEAEMEQCFEMGYQRSHYVEGYGEYGPDFTEFLQSLNTPKP